MNLQLTLIYMGGSGEDSDEGHHPDYDGGLAVEESKADLAPPPMYQIVMLDDDYTPMEFVVDVLQLFFNMDTESATRIMLTVHTQGKAPCGVFSKDIAETKAAQVIKYARDNQHPLLCEVEKIE